MKVYKLSSEKHFPGLGPAMAVSPTPQCYCCHNDWRLSQTHNFFSISQTKMSVMSTVDRQRWCRVTIRDNKNSVNWTDQINCRTVAVNSPGRRYSWFVMINVQFIILVRHVINLYQALVQVHILTDIHNTRCLVRLALLHPVV